MIEVVLSAPAETFGDWFFNRLLPPLITGVFIAAVASFAITRANERYKSRRDYLLRDVDALRSQLDDAVVLLAEYWTRNSDDHAARLEVEINYRLADIDSLVRACAPELWGSPKSRGPGLVAKLIAESASDKFGTTRLPADSERARRVAEAAAELAELATEQRRRYLVSAFRWPWQSKPPRYGS
jgi:hypothetical protein